MPELTELNRMTAAGWSPQTRPTIAQQCLLASARTVAAGKPGEAQRLTDIIRMLDDIDAELPQRTETSP